MRFIFLLVILNTLNKLPFSLKGIKDETTIFIFLNNKFGSLSSQNI